MTVAATVEDGTGVVDANSFATIDEVRAYASLRGATVATTDAAVLAHLVNGTAYLKQFTYLGEKVYPGEGFLPWPRSGLLVDGEAFGEDAIPQALKDAQCQLCVEQKAGVNLFPTNTAAAVKREKIGPIDTEYATSSRVGRPSMPLVEALLRDWITPSTRFRLRTRRV